MVRSIVTTDNKAEYDEAHMARRKREYDKDSAAAEKASKEAKDHRSHSHAAWAHRHASIYAHPPENVEKHLNEAKRHAAEARKHKRLEEERYVKEREENARKANIRSNKAMGITASTDEERRTGKYSTY